MSLIENLFASFHTKNKEEIEEEKENKKIKNLYSLNSPKQGLSPCLPGHKVIQNGASDLMREIRNLVSAPEEIYQNIYEKALYRFAEICQSMPYAEKEEPYSLLRRQLDICVQSLRVRRGLLLPENAAPEDMAKKEPQYNYAIVMASLLYGLDKIQHDRKIILYNNKGEFFGQWCALKVSLFFKDSCFKVQWQPREASETLPYSTFMCILSANIMPIKIAHWMSEDSKLVPIWWNAMTRDHPENNPISKIVQQAVEFIDDKNKVQPEKNSAYKEYEKIKENKKNQKNKGQHQKADLSQVQEIPENLMTQLLSFIETKQNTEHSHTSFLRVQAGLLITKTALQEFAINIHEKTIDSLVEKIKAFLICENDQYYLRYRHKIFEKRQFLEGIVIKNEHLDDAWKQQAVNDEFQPDIA